MNTKLKSFAQFWVFAMTCIISIAQDGNNVPYKILVDDASRVPGSYVDLFYFNYEGAMVNQLNWHKGFDGLGSSIQAEFKPSGKFGVQGRASVFYIGEKKEQMKLPFHLEAGGLVSLKSKIKAQEIKVPLKSFRKRVDIVDRSGNTIGSGTALAYNYIKVMADKEFTSWGRAGMLFRRATYKPMVDGMPLLGSQSVLGIFAGIEFIRKAHVETEVYDKVIVSAEYFKTYGDILFYPVATFSTAVANRKRLLGFRFGATGKLPGMKAALNYMFPRVEFGKLPLDGWYWNVGIGVNLYKK